MMFSPARRRRSSSAAEIAGVAKSCSTSSAKALLGTVLSLLADVEERDLPSPAEPLPNGGDIHRIGHDDLPSHPGHFTTKARRTRRDTRDSIRRRPGGSRDPSFSFRDTGK